MLNRRGMIFGGIGLSGLLAAGPALAMTLDQAKAPAKWARCRTAISASCAAIPESRIWWIRSMPDGGNATRKSPIRGAPMAAVEQLAGSRLIERAGSGEYILNGGSWVRK